jgi:hypothetical protein
MVGAGTVTFTVKLLADVAMPFGVVTVIFPVVVPFATRAVICVALFTVKLAADVALNFTEVAPVKFVPVIVTEVPAKPLVGLKLEIVGVFVIVKLAADAAVPPGVPTRIFPVVVLAATVAVICVALSTEKLAAVFPLNVTAVAPVRFVPVMTTTVPATPDGGVKLEIEGAAGGVVWFEVALPHAAMTSRKVADSRASENCRARDEDLIPANLLLTKHKQLGHATIPDGVSMGYCWGFGSEPQGCLSTKTLGQKDWSLIGKWPL